MKKYRFSQNSVKHLQTCHKDLQTILKFAISITPIDFGISEGYRSIDRQIELYRTGKSKINGIDRLSKHNYNPSLAVDIFAYVKRKGKVESYNTHDLALLAGIIIGSANHLYKEGLIKHRVRWGGNWDNDGEILTDQRFIDMPHFELY